MRNLNKFNFFGEECRFAGTELDKKANADGEYDSLTAGTAKQLLSKNSITDTEPYFLRPSASIGDREFDTLVGGSLGWNQLAKRDSSTSGSATINSSTDSSINATFTQASGWGVAYFTGSNIPFIVGHKYLFLGDLQLASAFTGNFYVVLGGTQSQADHYYRADTSKTTVQKIDTVINCVTAMETATIFAQTNVSGVTFDLSNIMTIDLTTLFGATIADYIYSLETAHAGDGVAWVRRYLTEECYAYCAPTLKHVTGVSAHVMRGFNQWDEETFAAGVCLNSAGTDVFSNASYATLGTNASKIRVLPNHEYVVSVSGVVSSKYYAIFDESGAIIGERHYANTYAPIVIPDNGRYMCVSVPYTSTTYNHDICINLSDASKNGTYEPYVSHSYPLDSTWVGMGIPKLDSDGKLYFDGDRYASDGTVTVRCGIRAYQSGDESLADAITDGTNTVYKLTTPTTSTASPFTNPQICDPNGTEEYVTTGLVPVGHETSYPNDLRGVLDEIATAPAEDGTYTLKCTKDGDTVTMTWVADE